MDLSIIIVTYNSSSVIKECIESIIEKTVNIKYEIIVVDNSSVDKTKEIVKTINDSRVILVDSPNKGFNYGNNRGIEISTGRYICLLNPDTIIINNAFEILINRMDNDNTVGVCGGQLLDINGNKNLTFGTFPSIKSTILRTSGLIRLSHFKGKNRNKYKVDYPIGADFLFRRSLIDKIGYLDEKYFLYFDETDFGYRIKKAGYKAYIYSDARIVHLEGKSTEAMSDFAKEKFLESYIYYNKKFLKNYQTKIIAKIELVGDLIRYRIKKLLRKKYTHNIENIKFNKEVLKAVSRKGNAV